jgi:hypothetical protein
LRDATAASAAMCESGVRIGRSMNATRTFDAAVDQPLHGAERHFAMRAAVIEEFGDRDFRIRRSDDIGQLRIEQRFHAADIEQRVLALLLFRGLRLRVQTVRHLSDDLRIGEQIFLHDLFDLRAVRPDADRRPARVRWRSRS